MEEESMRTVGEVPWLGSVFWVSFSAWETERTSGH